MNKFVFNLEKILNLRKNNENEKKIELGRTISALSAIENNIKSVAEEKMRISISQIHSGNVMNDLYINYNYLTRLDSIKEQLISDAAAAELKVDEARINFIEASKERKVLDRLKEKKEAEYQKKILLDENRALDEINSSAVIRKSFL